MCPRVSKLCALALLVCVVSSAPLDKRQISQPDAIPQGESFAPPSPQLDAMQDDSQYPSEISPLGSGQSTADVPVPEDQEQAGQAPARKRQTEDIEISAKNVQSPTRQDDSQDPSVISPVESGQINSDVPISEDQGQGGQAPVSISQTDETENAAKYVQFPTDISNSQITSQDAPVGAQFFAQQDDSQSTKLAENSEISKRQVEGLAAETEQTISDINGQVNIQTVDGGSPLGGDENQGPVPSPTESERTFEDQPTVEQLPQEQVSSITTTE